MNQSMIYIYLGIVMIVSLATAFYVRTVKNKLDTKVDAMFQLVQSMAREINSLKTNQGPRTTTKEVIELDLDSNQNRIVVSEHEESSSDDSYEDSETDESDTENTLKTTTEIEVTKLDAPAEIDEIEVLSADISPDVLSADVFTPEIVTLDNVDVVEDIKEIVLEPLDDQNFDALTVKELKELVVGKGGKANGKKKAELIEYLTT